MQKYSVNQHLIKTLLAWVESDEIAIPDIQRPFVWNASKVRDLLDSLYKGYPVGYIIVWKNPNVRLKDGSTSTGKKVLIDGQQRVTALTASLLGKKVVNKKYKPVNIVIAFNPHKETFEVSNPAIGKDKAWIPDIAPLMREEISQWKLIQQYVADNPQMDEEHLERILTRLKGISKKQIGIIELRAELDIETVTEIFIRINRKGVTLSQADFAMSKIAANEEFGGNQMRKAIDYFCHLAVAPEFYSYIECNDKNFGNTDYFSAMRWLRNENDDLYDPSYNDMLRVAYTSEFSRGKLADLVGLLSGRNFETHKFESDIAEKAFSDLHDGLLNFMNETNFKRFLMILKSAGFVDSSLVSGKAPLNFAYILYLRLRKDGTAPDLIERYVRRWFVLSLLTARYSGSMETRFDQDIRQISEIGMAAHLENIESADLSDVFWEVGLLQALTTSRSNNPAFRTFLASQVKSNARGFLSKEITVQSMLEHKGDIHHIFPKDYLKKTSSLTQAQCDQVANLVYTQQEINITIGNAPPNEYVTDLQSQCSTGVAKYGGIVDKEDLKANFAESAVPVEFLTGEISEYQEFLTIRRQLIASKLKMYYQSL